MAQPGFHFGKSQVEIPPRHDRFADGAVGDRRGLLAPKMGLLAQATNGFQRVEGDRCRVPTMRPARSVVNGARAGKSA